MLYFIIGTKAQFIKMAPVVHAANARGVRWRLVDMGQHADITGRILQDFELAGDVVHLFPDQRTVADYGSAFRWLMRLVKLLAFPGKAKRQIFNEPGTAFVHGDTLSTLFGALLARRVGLKVGLVEAGLTSGHLWSPFPEEIVRRLCERLSQFLFAPDDDAAKRLGSRNAAVINTGYNTGRDALLSQLAGDPRQGDHILMTLHRLETLRSSRRLDRAVDYLLAVAELSSPVKFVLHAPTRNALKQGNHFEKLAAHPNIELIDLLPYPEFLHLLATARVVLTDGGSVQEECSYLGTPCVVLREQTERPHGIGRTSWLTSWSAQQDLAVANISSATRADARERPEHGTTASDIIINEFISRTLTKTGDRRS